MCFCWETSLSTDAGPAPSLWMPRLWKILFSDIRKPPFTGQAGTDFQNLWCLCWGSSRIENRSAETGRANGGCNANPASLPEVQLSCNLCLLTNKHLLINKSDSHYSLFNDSRLQSDDGHFKPVGHTTSINTWLQVWLHVKGQFFY